MKKLKIIVVLSLLLAGDVLYLILPVSATTTIVFHPSDDTMIRQADSPSDVLGNSQNMVVRNAFGSNGNNVNEVDSLFKYDIFSLPPTATILSATLHLYYYNWSESNPAGRSLNLYRVNKSWTENSVRWYTKPSYASAPSCSSSVPTLKGQWMTWDVTLDVQNFVSEQVNYGWILKDDNYWGQANIPNIFFRTKEYGNYIPYLDVIFTIPESNKVPISGFSIIPLNPATKDIVQFTDASYDPDGTITMWFWNFGDGNTSTSRNPTHTYAQTGQYTITLQVTDNDGASALVTASLLLGAAKSTPGFEFVLASVAIVLVLFFRWKRNKQK